MFLKIMFLIKNTCISIEHYNYLINIFILVTNNNSMAVECKEYAFIFDISRVWNQISDVTDDKTVVGWYRFGKEAGYEIASKCNVNTKPLIRLGQPCGARFRGYMVDSHPTLIQGRVQRRICFTYPDRCSCEFFVNVGVRNCGNFYVYRLKKAPILDSRFCGAPKNSLSAGIYIDYNRCIFTDGNTGCKGICFLYFCLSILWRKVNVCVYFRVFFLSCNALFLTGQNEHLERN